MRRSERTIEFYGQAVRHLERLMLIRDLEPDTDGVTKGVLQELQLYLREKGLSPGGEHAVMRGLRATFRWAKEEELIERDPTAKFRMPSKPEVCPPAVSAHDAREALKACAATDRPLRNKAILLTLLDTGLRMGELIQLKWDDVDLERGVLRVRAETSKRRKERVVPFGVKTARALAAYERRERKPAFAYIDEVFVRRDGLPMTAGAMHNLMVGLAREIGVPRANLAPHAWRRAFATMALSNGVDVFALREMMGHATLEQTRVYTRLTADDLQRVHLRASPADRL